MSGISKNQRFRIVIPSHTGELHLLDKFMSSIKKWKPVYWLWSLQKACGLSRLIFTFANVFQFSFLFITIRINHFWYVTITLYENACHCYNNCHCTYCVPLFYVCSTFCAHCLCYKYICTYIYSLSPYAPWFRLLTWISTPWKGPSPNFMRNWAKFICFRLP